VDVTERDRLTHALILIESGALDDRFGRVGIVYCGEANIPTLILQRLELYLLGGVQALDSGFAHFPIRIGQLSQQFRLGHELTPQSRDDFGKGAGLVAVSNRSTHALVAVEGGEPEYLLGCVGIVYCGEADVWILILYRLE